VAPGTGHDYVASLSCRLRAIFRLGARARRSRVSELPPAGQSISIAARNAAPTAVTILAEREAIPFLNVTVLAWARSGSQTQAERERPTA
jgi:hypothetical protein